MRAKSTPFIAATAALAGVLVAAAFTPWVQTWAANRALAARLSPDDSVGRVAVGLGRAELENLRIETADTVFTAPLVEADAALLPALFGRAYHFRSLVAKGWLLDLSHSGAIASAGDAAGRSAIERALGAILAAFNAPADVALDNVDLEGDVTFPDERGQPAGTVHVVVTGGGLSAGNDGRFHCSAAARVDDPQAPVGKVALDATLTATMGASGILSRLDVRMDAAASGRQFPNSVGLSFAASATQGEHAESFSVSLIRGAASVAQFDGQSPKGSPDIAGSWRLDLRDSDLAPFALGRRLPTFYAEGRGDYEIDVSTGDVHANGRLRASADRLGVVARELSTVGRLEAAGEFDIARNGSSLRVSRLDASLYGAAPVGAVRALQAFEFDTSTGVLKVARPAGDLVGISLKALPLGWLGGVLPGLELSGSPVQGEFVMRAEDGRLALRTRAPLVSTGVSVARPGHPLASGLELSAFLMGDYAPQGWQIQLAPFSVLSDATKIFSLEARFGRLEGPGKVVKAAGSWSASLAPILAMPGASGLPRLGAGEASGSFEASLDSKLELRVKLALSGLSGSADPAFALPSVSSELRADVAPGGRATFNVPLRLDYGSRSATLSISGEVRSGADGESVDGTLSGGRLEPVDLAALGALFGRDPGAVASAPGATPAAPPGGGAASPGAPGPFWPDLRGRFSVRIDELVLADATLRNCMGTLLVAPDSLEVRGGAASLGAGSSARLDGRITYSPSDARAYSLGAAVSAEGVSSDALFRALDPSAEPVVDGRFDATSSLTGRGNSVAELLARIQGSLRLSSKDGIFRALRTDVVETIRQEQSKIIGALDTVTSFFGKKTDKIGAALVESAKGLSEIHYDQMSVAVERGEDLDVRITELTLLAPEERLTGTGRIVYAPGVGLRDEPLQVDLDVGVRGQLEKAMDLVGLLGDGQDELGYTHLYQLIHLAGSLRHVDQSQWREMLLQAPLRKGGGLIDKLLGR